MSDTPTPPTPGPSVAAQVATLADLGFGLVRIARRMGLPECEVLAIAEAAGVEVRRGGRPPVAHPRDHRVTLNLTAAEWAAIVASVADVGTVSVPEWCRGVVVAAAGGAR